ncbi:MAG: hypothetical protein AAF909_13925, partial [Pseudomonadota bacterium]
LFFLYQLGFASAAVTISSGAVTGRIAPHPYVLFAMIFTGVIYPLVAFTVWHPEGLLYGRFTDFAGGVVVHGAGAAAGLAGAILIGPRIGYNGYDPLDLGPERLFRIASSHAPHNKPLAALGVFLLWLGWFGFNGGTLLAGGAAPSATGEAATLSLGALMDGFGLIAVNTALAPCAAVMTTYLLQTFRQRDLDIFDLLNSVIAGLVAVTAGADVLSPFGAMAAGAGGAIIYLAARALMIRASVDDPVGAVAAHGFTGVFGAACVAVTAGDQWAMAAARQAGYGMAILGAVFFASLIAFKLADVMAKIFALFLGEISLRTAFRKSVLRAPLESEIQGLDEEIHGQDAYNFQTMR